MYFDRKAKEKVTDGDEKVTSEVILVFQTPMTFKDSIESKFN